MTDRPIIFSAPMIQALLAGRKTQTRRILKPQPPEGARYSGIYFASDAPDAWFFNTPHGGFRVRQAYDEGDHLWVREAHAILRSTNGEETEVVYRAGEDGPFAWKPSIHMPRWASRLTLLVTGVKVEQVQDISEEDAINEGVCTFVEAQDHPGMWDGMKPMDRAGMVQALYGTNKRAFQALWEAINGAEAWEANPWVVAVSFTAHKSNIDEMEER